MGLLMHHINDAYFSSIAGGVIRHVEAQGLVVFLASTQGDPAGEVEHVRLMRSHRTRALIVCGSRTTDRSTTAQLQRELEGYTAAGGRAALISQRGLGTHAVVPQNRAGARKLGRELTRLGHRRFAVLSGPPHVVTSRDRVAGFREGLVDGGVDLSGVRVLHGDFTRQGGERMAADLLTAGTDATCVFAVNDVMALGALAVFRRAGVRVPEDLSLAGFDDIPTLQDVVPGLTTVRLPLEHMGIQAAMLALDDEQTEGSRTVRVAGEVVLRDSTRALT